MTNVAVVLVTCNSMPGLTETLQSVLGQTQEPTALIAIDDYSAAVLTIFKDIFQREEISYGIFRS